MPQPEIYDFRHVRDVANIVPYDTLKDPSNHIFFSYIAQNFSDCKLETKLAASTLFPGAPEYAMPINFLLTKGEKKVAILLTERAKSKRYSVLETVELCKENGVDFLFFVINEDYYDEEPYYTNEESYVVDRIRKVLE